MIKTVKNINFHKDLYMDLFLPENEEFFTIVHFHGGGLVEGDKGDSHQFVEHLAKKGFAVATANYSLLPNNKFPSFILDAALAVKYVKDNISKFGKSKGIIISGQSAGAYLTLMLCLNTKYLEDVGIKNEDITAFISDSAQTTTHFNILKYEMNLSSLLQRIDERAPLFYVNENTNFNHLLLVSYKEDLANRLEQNKLFLSSLKNFNKDLDVELRILDGGHCHGSSFLGEDNEYPLIKEIEQFVKRFM